MDAHIDFATSSASMAHDQRDASDDAAADYFDNLRGTAVEQGWTGQQTAEAEEHFKLECARLGLRSTYLNI